MSPKERIQKIQDSQATTVGGGLLGIGGILLMFLPSDLRDGCLTAIQSSENPLVYGGVATLGILLTVIGPGIKIKK